MKKKMSFWIVGFLVLNQATGFGALSLEDLRLPKDFFTTQSPNATIGSVEEDPAFPGFLTFSVAAPHGTYKVQGLADLRQTLHEIDVIEKLNAQREDTGGGIAAGAEDSLKDTGRGAKNLVVHPVDSVVGIGKGVGKIGGKIGGSFRKKEEGEKGDTYLSGAKRQLAKQLGVDVYSRNPYLQEKMDAMAKARLGGRGIVMVAQFLIPVGLIASVALTASGLNNAADQIVYDNDRTDLYKLNEKALMRAGFTQEKAVALLNHPYYTPRELTYLRFYFEKFQGIPGVRTLMEAAIAVAPGVPAQKLLHEMQIAADSMTGINEVTGIQVVPEGIVLEKADTVVLVTGYDHLDASGFGKKVADQVFALKLKLGKKAIEIWNAGSTTLGFSALLLTKGIQSRRMCLFGKTPAA